MAWGSAQEAASVHALLQVFPDADVGEVSARGPFTIIDLSRGGIAAQLVCTPRCLPALMVARASELQLQPPLIWRVQAQARPSP
jgi:hypothetical protein